jgi:hypothetical protein
MEIILWLVLMFCPRPPVTITPLIIRFGGKRQGKESIFQIRKVVVVCGRISRAYEEDMSS